MGVWGIIVGGIGIKLTPVAPYPPPFKAPIQTIKILAENRELIWAFVKRNVRSRYRLAGLSYFWLILEPLLLAVTYWFLFIMLAGNADPLYPVWVLTGVIVWSTFGKSLSGSVTSLTSNAQLINTVYFPRLVFPMSVTIGNFVTSLGSSLVMIPIIIFFDTPLTIYLIFIPIGIFLAALMGGCLGLIFAPLNCKHRDFEHLIRFIVRAGFFFSPVMWTVEMALERGALGKIALYNPMATPITMVRHAIEGHSIDMPVLPVAGSFLFLILSYIFGAIIFTKFERLAVKYL